MISERDLLIQERSHSTMENFHGYASLKTTGQLVMDLGSVTTHIAALIALLRVPHHDFSVEFLKWFLVGTIIFQVLVAVGLYIFRTMDLNHEVNHKAATTWNWIFFLAIFVIAVLEIFIGVYEKFGLEHGPIGNCSSKVSPF